MFYDLLARFINGSSEWSTLKRGRDVFQHASELFQELFKIDSGFFIYKKRLPSESSDRFDIWQPWGIYESATDQLQTFLNKNDSTWGSFLQSNGEKWLDVNDVTFEVNVKVRQLGIWKLRSRGEVVGRIVMVRSQSKIHGDEEVISVCVKQISLIIDMMLAWRATDEMSRYDLLTGVFNRKGIFDQYESFISRAEINGNEVMIGVIDIDNFKQINDCYGHPEGDRILPIVATTLKNNISSGDLVGRFGGDEFVLIMQTRNQKASTLEQRIEELFPRSAGYTISVGFAIWNVDGNDWDTCYKVADKRLYNRKTRKKNMYRA